MTTNAPARVAVRASLATAATRRRRRCGDVSLATAAVQFAGELGQHRERLGLARAALARPLLLARGVLRLRLGEKRRGGARL